MRRWLVVMGLLGCVDPAVEADPTADGARSAQDARPGDARLAEADLGDARTGPPEDGGRPTEDAAQARPDAAEEEPTLDAAPPAADAEPADAGAGPPVDCSPLSNRFTLCAASRTGCTAVFDASEGCAAVCAAAGLGCTRVFENVDGQCAPDRARPELSCDPPSGHQSDYCECGVVACEPRGCAGRCGAGLDDGCGGPLDCPEACPEGACVDGRCAGAVACMPGNCLAFPGAEGEGREAHGGRGGDVYIVTSLADDGAGTLRRGLTTANGPRTIVFAVAGYIDLRSMLTVNVSNLTLAGQTAPGDGITVRDWGVVLRGNHNIIQHMRFRAGDRRKKTQNSDGFTEDSLTVSGENIMIDHVSASWGIDESLSAGPGAFRRLTIQHCIVSEGLYHTRLFHGEYDANHPGHSMGSLLKPQTGNATVSVHHTLYAHNNNRNPAIGTYEDTQQLDADLRGNVIYDCPSQGYVSGVSNRVRVNYVGNISIFGPASSNNRMFDGNADSNVQIYQTGNRRDLNRNGRFDGVDDGWAMLGNVFARADRPFETPPVALGTPEETLETVLQTAGARPWSRDGVDRRIVEDVRRGTGGRIDSQDDVGGFPALAAGQAAPDGDRDGMPDAWERDHGSNPDRADASGDVDGDGYTNLENYLHFAARLAR